MTSVDRTNPKSPDAQIRGFGGQGGHVPRFIRDSDDPAAEAGRLEAFPNKVLTPHWLIIDKVYIIMQYKEHGSRQ